MNKLVTRSSIPLRYTITALSVLTVLLLSCIFAWRVAADDGQLEANQHLVSVHDRGIELGIVTKATTLREAFAEAHISIGENDLVEPGLDEQLVASSYQVNIYRARPVVVVDGTSSYKVLSPHQTSKQIADDAGLELHDEDTTAVEPIADVASYGAGLQVVIDRATPFNLVLYGQRIEAYTQEKTVGDMLRDKKITLAANDTLSTKKSDAMTSGITVEVWHNGKQTVTEEQAIEFPVEKIQDADRPTGYREVKTPGEKGKRTVTYEVVMQDGKEVSRQEIQSLVTSEPKKQVELVGAKPSFSGDFAAALAKLRSCEGGYNSWNAAGPYYGAYQFDRQTWGTVADPAKYGSATPAEQDEAAHGLYVRRGWKPWPVCGAGLPDTYR